MKKINRISVKLVIIKLIISLVLISFPVYVKASGVSVDKLLELTNKVRVENHLPALISDPLLSESATKKAQDMIDHDYFAHNSPQGYDPWYWFDRVEYKYKYAGENLAIDFIEAEDIHNSWMNSPTHRANILDRDFEETGIAVVAGEFEGHQSIVVAVHFGTKTDQAKAKMTKYAQAVPDQDQQKPQVATQNNEKLNNTLINTNLSDQVLFNNEIKNTKISSIPVIRVLAFINPIFAIAYLL